VKFVLFTEGATERGVIGPFLKRWLDPRLIQPVGIHPVKFTGWSELIGEAPKRTRLYLEGPDKDEIIAVIGLMDLYGPNGSNFYPPQATTAAARQQ
jgi:hypothetical protein